MQSCGPPVIEFETNAVKPYQPFPLILMHLIVILGSLLFFNAEFKHLG